MVLFDDGRRNGEKASKECKEEWTSWMRGGGRQL